MKFLRVFPSVLMNELESGGGEAAPAVSAEVPSSYADVWTAARAQMDTTRVAAPPPVAPVAPVAPTLAPAPSTPTGPAPSLMNPEMAAMQAQQAAIVKVLGDIAARVAPQAAPTATAAAPAFDTAEVMVDFRPPLPQSGETQDAYDVRVQAASVNHLLNKRDEYFANHVMQQRIEAAFAARDAQSLQKQRQDRLNLMLDTEVEAAGIPRNSRAFALAKHAVQAELMGQVSNPATARWGEAEIRGFMRATAAELRPAPVATPAPAQGLTLVRSAPPISGSGGTGAGGAPPAQSVGRVPQNFTELFNRTG